MALDGEAMDNDLALPEEHKLPVLKLDPRQAQGFIAFYKTLPEDPRVVRFFDRKDYYTVHGEDAAFVARTYYKTMTVLHQLGNPPNTLAGASVSRSMFETILRDLLLDRTDHVIELYEGSGGSWQLTRTGTPGKLGAFEDILFSSQEMQDTPVVMAVHTHVKENERLVGMAFVDLSRRTLGMTEFLDDDQYTNLESAMVALGCKECIVPQEGARTPDGKKLRDVMARCNVLTTERKRSEFKARDLEEDLSRLVKGSQEQHRGSKESEAAAAAALAALMSYTELLADTANYGKFVIQTFVESADIRQDLRQLLKRIPDVERLIRKVERRRANLQDIVKLYQASVRLPFIKEVLSRCEGGSAEFVQGRYSEPLDLWTGPEHLGKFDGLVEAAVDLDQIESGEYLIDAGYDPSLGNIRAERDAVEDQIKNVHVAAANDLDLPVEKALKLDKTTQWGYVFRISKKEETKVRKKLNSNYINLETRKDGIKFTNTKLKRLSEQFTKLSEEYGSTQRELVSKVVDIAATFVEVFEGVSSLLADLDVLLGFADLAVSAPTPYVRPTITSSDEGDIILEGSRHPCVEVQEDVSFIPNDCCLVRGKSWFQIITGPNMGGKSTFIRQVGVNVLMAQVGSFVPCDRAQVSVRDCIFARVGAGDCQLRGVSTFMAEMLETSSILKAATDKSLIIIDELGRGTSTYDGFGLAWAICEYLTEVTRAPTLFATHFHELTALAENAGPPVHGPPRGPPVGVANYHVSAHIDDKTRQLTMLYKVEEGPCDQSFGIHVAEFAHFPESVVALARCKAAELEDFSAPTIGQTSEAEVGQKRKRICGPDEMERGSARARQFLRDFASLQLDRMDPAEARTKAKELREQFLRDAAGNPWLQQII